MIAGANDSGGGFNPHGNFCFGINCLFWNEIERKTKENLLVR